MPDRVKEKLVAQKIKGGAESICAKCFHNKVCKAMDNQPCIECNQFVDANGEWISVKDRLPEGADGKSRCENVHAYLNNGEVEAQVCPGWLNGDKWYLLVGDEDYHTV